MPDKRCCCVAEVQRPFRGARIRQALQIGIALWGMLLCLALAAAQWLDYAF
jgi:hypothetical protein